MTDLRECLKKGYLKKEKYDPLLVKKEFKEADYDLNKARKALEDKDFKWAIIKCYYSMFHAAKAILFSMGLREKRHFAVQVVLEDIIKNGRLESIYLEYLSASMEAREDADYRYTYSVEMAREMLEYSVKFISKMKNIVKNS